MGESAAGGPRVSVRKVVTAAWTVAMAALWVHLHLRYRFHAMHRAEEALVSMCEERARMLQDQFAVGANHVRALAILVSTFRYDKHPAALDQETFADYTARTAFERPLVSGVAFALPAAVPSPVVYTQGSFSYVEVLHTMSDEDIREIVLRERAAGEVVLSRPVRLPSSDHLGVVLTFPVHGSEIPASISDDDRNPITAGSYVGCWFDVESLVENLLRQLVGNLDIVVSVYDVTNARQPLSMYGAGVPGGFPIPSHTSILNLGDAQRKHHMICRYREKPSIPIASISNPTGIVVILMLLGYIAYAGWCQYWTVSEDCRKMEELKKRAEAADVAKSQFLATVSHEIRTPLNGVLGMLDMLLDTDLDPLQTDHAETAQLCGKALISLINEVLDRAKIEAGMLELESVPFDLRSVLDDVVSQFAAKSRDKGVELAAYVADGVPEILLGDPGRFRQIIANLVGNSIKFTERGHIFVQVHLIDHSEIVASPSCEEQDDLGSDVCASLNGDTLSGYKAADGRNCWDSFSNLVSQGRKMALVEEDSGEVTLVVSVEDTGIGIPLHAQGRVFAPFMQADSSTSRNYGGTGIGLSISRCLVELMGGRITFVSRPHVGTTFTFTVALRRCLRSGAGEPEAGTVLSSFNSLEVILVDERPVRAAVTKYHLQRLGITADVVTTISQALAALSTRHGSTATSRSKKGQCLMLIESDSSVLDGDGTLTDHLGVMSQTIKIVLLTAMELERMRTKMSADAVILKPLNASNVAAGLRVALGIDPRDDKLGVSGTLASMLAGKNVLVVDDNKVNLMVACRALNKYGAAAVCAESGTDALALLRPPHKFDICFMDVQMPEMDGFEATRRIREIERAAGDDHRRMPILAMTADVVQATHDECVRNGMDGYVAKPFEERQLRRAIEKLLSPATE